MKYLDFDPEKAFDRLKDLYEFIEYCPDSPLSEIVLKEIEEIEKFFP